MDDSAHDSTYGTAASCRVRRHRAFDADAHAGNLSQWEQCYDQISAGPFDGAITELWLPQTQIFVERANRQLRQTCAAWKNSLWFGIPAAEDGKIWMGSRLLAAHEICVRAGGREIELLTAPDFDLFGIVVDRRAFAEYVDLTTRQDLDQILARGDVIALAPARKDRLCALLDDLLGNCDARGAAPLLLQRRIFALLADLLCSGESACVARRRSMRRHRQVVTKLHELVLARPTAAPAIPELCNELHISRRTLQNCVEEVSGLTPISYIRSIRLNEVRRRLRKSDAPISRIAYAWGFNHLSQFAQDYRRLFGSLPSASR